MLVLSKWRSPFRCLGTAGGGDRTFTRRSQLLYKWEVDYSDGRRKEETVKVRADHVHERGVARPDWLLEARERAKKRARPSTYAALADAATREAEFALGECCAAVTCECPPPSCIFFSLRVSR